MILDTQNTAVAEGIVEESTFVFTNLPKPPVLVQESIGLIGTSTGTNIKLDGNVDDLGQIDY